MDVSVHCTPAWPVAQVEEQEYVELAMRTSPTAAAEGDSVASEVLREQVGKEQEDEAALAREVEGAAHSTSFH